MCRQLRFDVQLSLCQGGLKKSRSERDTVTDHTDTVDLALRMKVT